MHFAVCIREGQRVIDVPPTRDHTRHENVLSSQPARIFLLSWSSSFLYRDVAATDVTCADNMNTGLLLLQLALKSPDGVKPMPDELQSAPAPECCGFPTRAIRRKAYVSGCIYCRPEESFCFSIE